MSEIDLVNLYQYLLYKSDRLKDDSDSALYYLQKNKFHFDYDIINAWKAIIKKEFFDEVSKQICDLLHM